MARFTGPGHRTCKRAKQPLCGLSSCPMNKERLLKKTNPGTLTDVEYRSRSLIEQQKARYHYGLTEAQLRKCLLMAQKREGPLADTLLQMLETRFDVLLLRLGFSRSLVEAREVIELGYVKLNGSKVNIASHPIHPGDIIEIRQDTPGHDIALVALAESETLLPYLKRDEKNCTGQLLKIPNKSEVPIIINMDLVIQYYNS